MSIASIKPLLARRGLDSGRLAWFTCCRSIIVSRAERRERLCCSASHNSKPRRVASIHWVPVTSSAHRARGARVIGGLGMSLGGHERVSPCRLEGFHHTSLVQYAQASGRIVPCRSALP